MRKAATRLKYAHYHLPKAPKPEIRQYTRFEVEVPATERKRRYLSAPYFRISSDVAYPLNPLMVRTSMATVSSMTTTSQPHGTLTAGPTGSSNSARRSSLPPPAFKAYYSHRWPKIEAFPLAHLSTPMQHTSNLLYFHDKRSDTKFLVDCGSIFSFLPADPSDRPIRTDFNIIAANGTDVQLYEPSRKVLQYGNLSMPWRFFGASVKTPILGADFLAHHKLLIDLPNKRLVHEPTGTALPCEAAEVTGICYSVKHKNPARALLDDYPEITDEIKRPSKILDVEFEIKLKKKHEMKPPYTQHFNPQVEQMIDAHFQELERLGVVQRAGGHKPPFSSPLAVVIKRDGTLRICGDYRSLNLITVNNSYGLPHLPSFNNRFAGSKHFTVIDLRRAYYQIPIKKSDRWKTAVRTPGGTYIFNYMSFGLKCASQQFQAIVDKLFADSREFVYGYIDDLIIHSKTLDLHMNHLRFVFDRLKEYGLKVNVEKSQFCQTSVTYLGYRVDENGVTMTDERVQGLLNIQPPETFKQLRSFLCTAGYYHRFLPGYNAIAKSLTALQPPNKRQKDAPVRLTTEQIADFNSIKQMIAQYAKLSHPVKHAPLILETDASDRGAGAVLYQFVEQRLQPLYFYSKGFTAQQRSWPIYRRELEALYSAIVRMESMLIGQLVIAYTDNAALLHNVRQPRLLGDNHSFRKLVKISEIVDQIYFVPSAKNVIADYLSRIPELELFTIQISNYLGSRIDYHRLSAAQATDPWTKQLAESLEFKRRTKCIGNRVLIFWVRVDESGRDLICVPNSHRLQVFEAFHGLHHPGWARTYRLLAMRFFWPLMRESVRYYTKCCERCQANKTERTCSHPLRTLIVSTERFAHIHMDTVGPFPDEMVDSSNGFRYVLTIRDQFTRFLMLIPLRTIKLEEVFCEFVNQWIGVFGLPKAITTDNHESFCNHLLDYFTDRLNIARTTSLPHRPRGNALIERPHRQINTTIRCNLQHKHWSGQLKFIQLCWNNTSIEGSAFTPHQLTFGYSARLPSDFLEGTRPLALPQNLDQSTTELLHIMSALSPVRTTHNNTPAKPFVFKDLATCKSVWLRDMGPDHKYTNRHRGPYKVIERHPTYFVLEDDSGKPSKQSIELLKPAYRINSNYEITPLNLQFEPVSVAEQCRINGHNQQP